MLARDGCDFELELTSLARPCALEQLAKELEKSSLVLIGKFVSSDGKSVDYKSLRASAEFGDFRLLARELQRLSLAELTPIGKKTFFISMLVQLLPYLLKK